MNFFTGRWIERNFRAACSRPRPYLVVRRTGRGISEPITLDPRAPVHAAAVAINVRGDTLAVWERPLRGSTGRRGIYARVWSPPPAGCAGRSCSARPNRCPCCLSPTAATAQRVERVPQLPAGQYVGQAGVRVAIEQGGRMLAAWTGYANDRSLAAGRFAERIQRAGRKAADVEFAPGTGRAVVVWRDLEARSVVSSWRQPMS